MAPGLDREWCGQKDQGNDSSPHGSKETLVALWNLMDPQSHCDIGVGWCQGDLEILQTKDTMVTPWKLMEPWAL